MAPDVRPTESSPAARVSARHTLGSDPDGAGAPVLDGGESRLERESPPAELTRPVWWLAVHQRAGSWPDTSETAKVVARLVGQVDEMWRLADELETLYFGLPRQPSHERSLLAHFLSFIERDVVKLFWDLARQVAFMLSDSGEIPFDPTAFDAEGDRFTCNVDVMRLAASDPVVPEPVRAIVQRAARHLSQSYPDLAALVGALATAAWPEEHRSRHA